MYKARDLIGLPVIGLRTGRRIGMVKDLLFDGRHELRALLLEPGHFFSSAKAIGKEHVVAWGEDAITVAGRDVLVKPRPAEDWYSLHHAPRGLQGVPVMSTTGCQLGTLEDVYIDGNMGMKVIGFELSDGFISDVTEGRRRLPIPDRLTIGEDALIVPADSEIHLDESILLPSDE